MSLQLTSGLGEPAPLEVPFQSNEVLENLSLLSYSYCITGISKPADYTECTKQIHLKNICKSYYTRYFMLCADAPIGVLDAGFGGYTVVKELQKILPNENIMFYGDGKNQPYGNRSKRVILDLIHQCLAFFQ